VGCSLKKYFSLPVYPTILIHNITELLIAEESKLENQEFSHLPPYNYLIIQSEVTNKRQYLVTLALKLMTSVAPTNF
jgi:hypothetical protein